MGMTGNPAIYTKMAINAKAKNKKLLYQSQNVNLQDKKMFS